MAVFICALESLQSNHRCSFCSSVVLSEVIQAFSVPENAVRMEEARESACNDMGKMLQLVLPVATQIQQEVIKAYGFNNEGEGDVDVLQYLIVF